MGDRTTQTTHACPSPSVVAAADRSSSLHAVGATRLRSLPAPWDGSLTARVYTHHASSLEEILPGISPRAWHNNTTISSRDFTPSILAGEESRRLETFALDWSSTSARTRLHNRAFASTRNQTRIMSSDDEPRHPTEPSDEYHDDCRSMSRTDVTDFEPSAALSQAGHRHTRSVSKGQSSSVTSSTPSSIRQPRVKRLVAIEDNTACDEMMIHSKPMLSKKIRHLMHVTRGHMQGEVLLRRSGSNTWIAAYCAIITANENLRWEPTGTAHPEHDSVASIRGCRIKGFVDQSTLTTTIRVQLADGSPDLYLRPEQAAEVYRWQAALMCWQAINDDQSLLGRSSLHGLDPPILISATDAAQGRDTLVCKVRKMKLWMPLRAGPAIDPTADDQPTGNWKIVNCMLRHNGDLEIYSISNDTIAVIPMSRLSRSAVQRVDPSVLDTRNCIAILPEYSLAPQEIVRIRPLYLGCESRVMFEVWYVLLRAFTKAELYGRARPEQDQLASTAETFLDSEVSPGGDPQVFRIERTPNIQICEFEDRRVQPRTSHQSAAQAQSEETPELHVQILIDGHLRARTKHKSASVDVSWYEQMQLLDIPAMASCITFRVVQSSVQLSVMSGHKGPEENVHKLHSQRSRQSSSLYKGIDLTEQVAGEITISMDEFANQPPQSSRLMLLDEFGESAGTLSIKARLDEDLILMDEEYSAISEMLHSFSNSLTIDLSERVPQELARLTTCLLNIFQVSGRATEWLMSLAEDEIDGNRNEPLADHAATDEHGDSQEKHNHAEIVRDAKQTAAAEVNLLFRGSTLLSKALDMHMKRMGKDYLEETLGSKIRELMRVEPDLEIDPQRLSPTACLPYNLQRLQTTSEDFWSLIANSAASCPVELRQIFHHIRACAEERFGDGLRNAPYTAVSGFIFLRFFGPAILNPALFGLTQGKSRGIRDLAKLADQFPEPLRPRAQRNLTLIAKSIQGLANQTTFGSKEAWMESMNPFLASHRTEFKDFIDAVCTVPAVPSYPLSPPSYSAPMQIFTRLPPLAREGYPSLPHLIDYSHSFAALVKLWLDYDERSGIPWSNGPNSYSDPSPALVAFQNECARIRRVTAALFARAERLEGRDTLVTPQAYGTLAASTDPEQAGVWSTSGRSSVETDRLIEGKAAGAEARAHALAETDRIAAHRRARDEGSGAAGTKQKGSSKKARTASPPTTRKGTGYYYMPDADDPAALHFGPDPVAVATAAGKRPPPPSHHSADDGISRSMGRLHFRSRSRSRPGNGTVRHDDGRGLEETASADEHNAKESTTLSKSRRGFFGRRHSERGAED